MISIKTALQPYDEYNAKVFRESYDDGTYICCNCGRLVPLESSNSSGGKHLICNYCRRKIATLLNISDKTVLEMIHATE